MAPRSGEVTWGSPCLPAELRMSKALMAAPKPLRHHIPSVMDPPAQPPARQGTAHLRVRRRRARGRGDKTLPVATSAHAAVGGEGGQSGGCAGEAPWRGTCTRCGRWRGRGGGGGGAEAGFVRAFFHFHGGRGRRRGGSGGIETLCAVSQGRADRRSDDRGMKRFFSFCL